MIITKIDDSYTEQVSYLICMMNYTRNITLSSVEGLTERELDTLIDSKSNSIGALLLHIAAIEYAYFINTFEEREMNEQEMEQWGPALRLGQEGRDRIRGNKLIYYIDKLNAVRTNTLRRFKDVDDEWLYAVDEYYQGTPFNRFFKWFHVFEDEINHRGQINFIKQRVTKA
ncbi:DinB family protein [Bacillus sp. FJAT-49711]|uniref:DinB family protein n=1 Tax=Bacillus sp. FJAT-49711 TaxID=2833585 RepID=UPI002015E794|nr:DinB family protein [Bacillus sp. FJAT-49711]